MKVLQVVTLVSPDFAYGGPVRVALNHSRALSDNGHQVTLLAMERGVDRTSPLFEGFETELFPARHVPLSPPFAGLLSIPMLRWFIRHHREYDVVHVHLAREIEVAALARIRAGHGPLVVQPHGMIGHDRRLLSRALDRCLLTTVLSTADAALFLTDHERRELERLSTGRANLVHLPNGVPVPATCEPGSGSEVLFMARMHARKNPVVFARAAANLAPRFPGTQFSIMGPDGGETSAVRTILDRAGAASVHLGEAVPPEQTAERLRRCSIYVLPSVNEPFPMSVLEAMAMGRPVIITDTNGLAETVERAACGLVVEPTVAAVEQAISRLLDAPEEAREMGRRAQETVRSELSLDRVGSRLADVYRAAAARAGISSSAWITAP